MSAIFNKAKRRLHDLIDSEKDCNANFPDSSSWQIITSKTSGYIEDISLNAVFEAIKDCEIKVDIIAYKGEYVFEGIPLIKIESELEQDVIDDILSAFNFSKSELIEDNYLLAFKQLTEIAVKAMSPGINDPGTAINAIDYLTELFLMRMLKKDESYYFNESGNAIIHLKSVDFKVVLYEVMAALRTYCKHDVIIVQKLLIMLGQLLQSSDCKESSYKDAVLKEAKNLYEDAAATIQNKTDLEVVSKQLNILKQTSSA